ncbi:MAG: hypothetical protein ACJ8G3_05960 [Burkholderiaceae bacterium]
MVPVPYPLSSPSAAPSSGADDPPSPAPASQGAPVLSQQADDGIRRFFNTAYAGPPAQPAGPQPARMPAVLSQAWSALPPTNTQD